MIVVIVRFELAEPLPQQEAATRFARSVPKHLGVRGLIRKYFGLSPDGRCAAGIYLWESREDAARYHSEEWREIQSSRFGIEPHVAWLDCLAVADNSPGAACLDGDQEGRQANP